MQYLGIDCGTRKAAWCAIDEHGGMAVGMISADEDGLAKLVHALGADVRGCVEMMSGAVWVRDRLTACGWQIEIAEPRKVKALAPLACKTDRVDARVLAEIVRRDLVPALWVPSLSDRELRERLRRRSHLVRLRTSATNRAFGLLTQWGLRVGLTTLREPAALDSLRERGVPAVWVESISTLLSVIDGLDRQIAPIERELRPLAHADEQGAAADDDPRRGRAARPDAARRDRRRLPLPKRRPARRLLRSRADDQAIGAELPDRAAVEGRTEHSPLGRDRGGPGRLAADEPVASALQRDQAAHGKANPAKAAVARKVLNASWHVLTRNEPFKRSASSNHPCPGKLLHSSGRLKAHE